MNMKKIFFSSLSVGLFLVGVLVFVIRPESRSETRVLGMSFFDPKTAMENVTDRMVDTAQADVKEFVSDTLEGDAAVSSQERKDEPEPEPKPISSADTREEESAPDSTPATATKAIIDMLPAPVVSDSDDASTDSDESDQVVGRTAAPVSDDTVTKETKPLSPPSVPTGVSAEMLARNVVRIRWQAAYGNFGTIRYAVYRDGNRLGTADGLYYDDRAVEAGQSYEYSVAAIDNTKNASEKSIVATVTVPAADADLIPQRPSPVVLTVGRIPSAEKIMLDSDSDGISDAEEERLGTERDIADSDGDGFSDGDEIRNGFDPLRYSIGDKSDKIAFESPKDQLPAQRMECEDERYAVRSVERVASGGDTDDMTTIFTGTGLPDSYLTLYIYSDPIIVTVKTDSDGNWRYELDRDLEDGDHEVYVAVTDNLGRLTAQSKPLPFVKTAQAVTVDASALPAPAVADGNRSPASLSLVRFVAVGLGIASLAIILILVAIRKRFPSAF